MELLAECIEVVNPCDWGVFSLALVESTHVEVDSLWRFNSGERLNITLESCALSHHPHLPGPRNVAVLVGAPSSASTCWLEISLCAPATTLRLYKTFYLPISTMVVNYGASTKLSC